MRFKSFFLLPVLFSIQSLAQFKNDNVLYKTVDPADLCSMLDQNKGYLLLDVRSKPEHNDTSSFAVYNLGHFKGARNIDIVELDKRLNEIRDYKDKPVFVYCSHSQRSRRASKMLADSGFTKVFNINGGMTSFHYRSLKDDGCLSTLYETKVNYEIISYNQLCQRMQGSNSPFLMDVRTDSAFRHITPDPAINAMGTIKGSVNIPLSEIQAGHANIPKNGKEIIITDLTGNDAAIAASLLKKNGFGKVSILIEGIDRLMSTDRKDLKCPELYQSPVAFNTINSSEFGRYIKANPGAILLDVRTEDEFQNKYKDYWRNIGKLKNSINFPLDKLDASLSSLDRNREIVVYDFSGGTEAYRAASVLNQNGYKHVNVLAGGLFDIRWSSGNVKGQEYLRDFVVDVPERNQ